MKCSYKGAGGGYIEIDGDDVTLKFALIKEVCKLWDIVSLKFTEPELLQRGCLEIKTVKQQGAAYSIFFKKKDRDELYQIYQHLLENAPRARETPDPAYVRQLAALYANSAVRCPKCGSTSISSGQKGFSAGKAVVGAAVTGSALGLAAGAVGSKKVIITCLNCGHQWQAGKK